MFKYSGLVLTAVLLNACTTLPDAKINYYLPKSSTALSATQTLSCTKDGHLIALTSVQTPVTSYSADRGARKFLHISDFDNGLSDTDVTVTLYDDGRLKTINATMTGQGETILKSAINLGTALAGAAAFAEVKETPCTILQNWVGADKPATLSYATSVSFDAMNSGKVVTLDPALSKSVSVNDTGLYDQLKDSLPMVIAVVNSREDLTADPVVFGEPGPSGQTVSAPDKAFPLTLRKTSAVHLDFFACTRLQCKPDGKNEVNYKDAVWMGASAITVPQVKDGTYELYLPKGEAFGSAKFGLALSEAGAIQSIQYAKGAGAAGVMNVASQAITAATPPAVAVQPPQQPTKPTNASN